MTIELLLVAAVAFVGLGMLIGAAFNQRTNDSKKAPFSETTYRFNPTETITAYELARITRMQNFQLSGITESRLELLPLTARHHFCCEACGSRHPTQE